MDTTADGREYPRAGAASMATVVVAVLAASGIASAQTPLVIVVIGAAMLALANGWVRLLQLPSPRGTTAVQMGAGLLVLTGGLWSREIHVSLLPASIACALILEFVHQLGRRDRRPRLVESVSSSVFGIAIVTSGACFLVLDGPVGTGASLVTIVGALASVAADPLARNTIGVPWGAVAATGLGAALGYATWVVTGPPGLGHEGAFAAVAGGAAALASFALRRAMSALPTIAGFRARWTAGASCVLAVGVVAYSFAWAVLGSLSPLLHR